MKPQIVLDDAVGWRDEAFGQLGRLRPMPGGAIDRSALHEAEVLIVRSVIRIDAELLRGTPVRFVGSATAGQDHIDRDDLEALGITFVRAPGCNAQAVAEYVVSVLAHARHWDLGGPPGPVGVVGLGHVGRRVTRALRALGYEVLACDPPLAEQRERGETIEDPDPALVALAHAEPLYPIEQLLASALVLTFHVPLVRDGRYPTARLLNAERLRHARPGQLVLNTSRGQVIDEPALEHWLTGGGHAVLDVWDNEPLLRPSLFGPQGVHLATPHVAGYSLGGKVAATRQIHEGLCRFLDRAPDFDGSQVLGPAGVQPLRCDDPSASRDWRPWVEAAIPLKPDDAALRQVMALPLDERGEAFEQMRRRYAFRRELSSFHIDDTALEPEVRDRLAALGIRVSSRGQ